MNEKFDVYVLFRFSKKTGKVDITMTAITLGMLEMQALQKTTKTKATIIINRETGDVVFICTGEDGFPKAKNSKKENLGKCTDYGIPYDLLKGITDDRFDVVG